MAGQTDLAWLVRLFPDRFKNHFGQDLTELVLRDFDRAAARGTFAKLHFTLTTASDLVRSSFAERWSPSWAHDRRPTDDERGMTTMLRALGRDLALASQDDV